MPASTEWTASGDLEEPRAALSRLPSGPAIVKDYVKSAKHRWHHACFIPDTRDEDNAMRITRAFLDEQMPVIDERRVFLWRGRPLHIQGDEASFLRYPRITAAIAHVRSPFVNLDLARLEDDTLEVVEVGDGQVSGPTFLRFRSGGFSISDAGVSRTRPRECRGSQGFV